MTWDEAIKVLPRTGAMENTNNNVVTIRLGYDFEPHGRASETWEDVWSVHLWTVPGFWKSTTGWRRATVQGMDFKRKTLTQAQADAIDFIEWWSKERPA